MTTLSMDALVSGWIDADQATTWSTDNSFFATGYFGTPQTNRGFLLFDIETLIPRDATVTAATLKLYVETNFLGTNHTLNIYRVKRRWHKGNLTSTVTILGTATWNVARPGLNWATAGCGNTASDRDADPIGSVALTAASAGQLSITLDPALVQEWVDGTLPNDGLILVASNEAATTLMRWGSHKDGTPAHRPILEVVYTPAAHTLLDNLVSYWTMDEASGNRVDVVGGHNLAPVNTPSQVAGLIGNAAGFASASSQYLYNNDAALKISNLDFTIAGWTKLTDKLNYYVVVANSGSDVRGFKLFYHKVDVLDYFVAQLYDDAAPGDDSVISDVIGYQSGNPSADTFIFFALRHDATRKFWHLFIDDHYPDSAGHHDGAHPTYGYTNGDRGPYAGTPAATTVAFTLGASLQGTGDTPDQPMNGAIDEVGFWSRCLTNDEIAALYNGGVGLTHPFGIGAPRQAMFFARGRSV